MSPFPRSSHILQFSLRTFVAFILGVNITAAAWFQWTWEVKSPPHHGRSAVLAADTSELILAEFAEIGLPPYHARYGSWNSTSSCEAVPPSMCSAFGRQPPMETWSGQVAFYRRSWEHGRERHGVTRLFYENGGRHGEEDWCGGRPHGRYERWYPNGRQLVRGGFRRGERHGVWTLWDPQGAVILSAEFEQGRAIGRWEHNTFVR